MEVRNGTPIARRNDKAGLDMYRWPDGRWVRIHDNGNMTVGQAKHEATANARNYRQGNRGSVVTVELTEQEEL